MHLFDQWIYGGSDPTASTWLSTIPWWILDWQHTEEYLQKLLDEYNRNAGAGPDRRDITTTNPTLPVGDANVLGTPEEPGIELSNLVIAESALEIHAATTGAQTTMAMTDAEWWAMMYPGQPYLPPGTAPPATQNLAGGDTVPSGDIFGDLGDVFVDWVGQQVLDQPSQALGPNVTTQLVGQVAPPAGAAPGTVAAAACSTGASPVYKKVCGVYKWVYPKRRRRRALLTNGDYNDLLRIEGLKVNKNMTAAIAKALTR